MTWRKCKERDRRKICFVTPEGIDEHYIHKILELIFRKSSVKVIYLRKMSKQRGLATQKVKERGGNPIGRKAAKTVVVKMEGEHTPSS